MLSPEAAGRVAVVVVSYGSSALLRRHLVEVTSRTPGLHVVVVDNFTDTEEREAVATLGEHHGWQTLLLDDNTGFGAGNNRAVETLGPEIEHIVMLNPDASLDAASLARLVAHAQVHPDHLVGPVVRRPDGRLWSTGSDLLLRTGEMRGWHRRPTDADPSTYQPWLSGACLALSRSLWDRVGGFDDDYFLYWEDVDLSRRVLDAGGELVVLDDAVAVHDEGGTHVGEVDVRVKSPLYYYFNTRNRLLFAAKHLDAAAQRRWRRTAPRAGYQLLLQGGRRQLVHPSRTWLPVARGLRDGRRLARLPRH